MYARPVVGSVKCSITEPWVQTNMMTIAIGTHSNQHTQPYVFTLWWRSLNILLRIVSTAWHCHLTVNVLRMGKVSHVVTVFSGTPLCQFTQPVRRLRYQMVSLWNSQCFVVSAVPAHRCHVNISLNCSNSVAFDAKTCALLTAPNRENPWSETTRYIVIGASLRRARSWI